MILFAVFSALVFSSCGETEKKRRTTGYKGEARSNAFLAATRLLERNDYDVEQRSGLGELGYSTSTVFLAPSSLNTMGRAKRLMQWVEQGGHLVFMVSGGEKSGNDFKMDPHGWSMFDDESSGVEYLFDELNVEVESWDTEPENTLLSGMDRDDWEAMSEEDRVLLGSEVSEFQFTGKKLKLHHWADKGLIHEVQFTGDMGSEDVPSESKHRFLSLVYGSGRVTILSDARPLRNRFIGQADHAQLLIDLVDISPGGMIVFTNGAGESFFSLVWRYFWMAVIAVGVAIIFWLWKNLPRFGPTQDLPESNMREYLGQVRGIGRFLWRNKRDDAMLGAMRRNINRRLALISGEHHEGIFEQLSETTGLSVEQVIEAMTREQIREPGTMVRVTRNLQQIYQHIN
ncbi:MAG: DUF4350 domain-containing protein [Akkermansiaceae bacterium]